MLAHSLLDHVLVASKLPLDWIVMFLYMNWVTFASYASNRFVWPGLECSKVVSILESLLDSRMIHQWRFDGTFVDVLERNANFHVLGFESLCLDCTRVRVCFWIYYSPMDFSTHQVSMKKFLGVSMPIYLRLNIFGGNSNWGNLPSFQIHFFP